MATTDGARFALRSLLLQNLDLIVCYRRVHWPIRVDYVMEPESFVTELERLPIEATPKSAPQDAEH